MKFKSTIPEDLVRYFKERRVSIFIGAGLSAKAGLPSWSGLLNELLNRVKKVVPNSSAYAARVEALLMDPANYLMVAEDLKEKLGTDEFNKYIRERFVDNRPEPTETHKKIIDLPYNCIITTNYDYLIEDAYAFVKRKSAKKYTYEQAQAMADNIWNKYHFILKAHGDADEPSKVILSDQDYRNIINAQVGYRSLVQVLFTNNSILFLGTSMTDHELKLLLSFVRYAYHDGGPKHFALMDKSAVDDLVAAERWRKDYGITIIPYDSTGGHEQVDAFVDDLSLLVANPG